MCDKVEEMKRMEPQLNLGTLELGERGFLQQKKKGTESHTEYISN